MIYSRFGTQLTAVSKEQDASGRMSIHVSVEGLTDLRSYAVAASKRRYDCRRSTTPWRSCLCEPRRLRRSHGRASFASPRTGRIETP